MIKTISLTMTYSLDQVKLRNRFMISINVDYNTNHGSFQFLEDDDDMKFQTMS